MAEQITIARPYAEAVFLLAKKSGAFAEWSRMLEYAGAVLADEQMASLVGNPRLTRAQVEGVFVSVCERQLNEQGLNLIRVLVENRRLQVLPEIRAVFEKLRAEQEGVLEARIRSAFPLSDAQVSELLQALEARFRRKVTASTTVDPELIGGIKIEVGDEVFDASVRGRLQNMAFALKH